jgi:hypothetical protein
MNAHFRKRTGLTASLLCLATLSASLGACARAFAPSTDPTSPIAPRVQALVDANRHYPSWENFPAAPADLPQAAQVAARVQALEGQGGALDGEVARIDWTLGDAETLAAETRAQVGGRAGFAGFPTHPGRDRRLRPGPTRPGQGAPAGRSASG